jgi:Heavy-metal resistance
LPHILKKQEINSMKKSRKVWLLPVLALALSLGLAGSVWAQHGMGMGMGMGMMNMTPEQAGQVFDLKEKMRADTADLRKQMMVKHAELAALWRAQTPDQSAIQAKQKEINAIRDQLQDKMTTFMLEAKKICPGFHMGLSMFEGCYMGTGPETGPGTGPGPGPGALQSLVLLQPLVLVQPLLHPRERYRLRLLPPDKSICMKFQS